jgi:predicted nicotinamide N-methyase
LNSPAPSQSHTARPPLRAFGRTLEFQRPPLCPEIGLWLLEEGVDIEATSLDLAQLEAPPFWAFCWGSGQALARFILDHPEKVRGQRVVDFGTGSGVAAIAAALAGAASVTAVDLDAEALTAASLNAKSNRVSVDSRSTLPGNWDLLLASDVLYESGQLPRLRALARSGRPVLISDPERPSSPRLEMTALARYAVRTLPDVDSPMKTAAVFELGAEDLYVV